MDTNISPLFTDLPSIASANPYFLLAREFLIADKIFLVQFYTLI